MYKQRIEINNEHIWQYNDLDSNALSILHMDRQLVDNVYEFKQRLQEISVKCDDDMAIKVHGTESSQQKGVIWIRIHSKSADSRREAIRLINEFTDNACKEVIIPKLSQEHTRKIDEVNEYLQRQSIDNNSHEDDCLKPVVRSSSINDARKLQQLTTMISSQSFIATNGSSSSNDSATNISNKKSPNNSSSSGRRPLVRSSTENFINSLERANSSTPFGSILAPLAPISKLDEEEQITDEPITVASTTTVEHKNDQKEVTVKTDLDRVQERKSEEQQEKKNSSTKKKSKNEKGKHLYSLDFLLSRANCESSKQMPSNWRQLNELYPNICFAGKVISYFNPEKYHEHWVRVQNQNPDWHHPIAWVQRRLGPALVKQIRQHFNNNSEDQQQHQQQQQYNPRWNYNNPQYNQTNQQYHHNHRTNNTSNNNQHSTNYYLQHRESATALMQPNQYRQFSMMMTQRNGGVTTNSSKQQQQQQTAVSYKQPTHKQPIERISSSIAQQKRSMNSQQQSKVPAAANKHTDRFYD